MIKLTLALLASAMLVGMTVVPSTAAVSTRPGCYGPGCGTEPGPTGEPFTPLEECMFNCGDISTIPDPKQPDPEKPGTKTTEFALGGCGEKLGALRRVTTTQIRGVDDDDNVDIVPVCRSQSLATEQDSVAELRPEIDSNDTLHNELRSDGYNASDVVGVIVNGKAVTLYVHRI